MKIKLIIASRLSYYFCGSISLSILNTIDNPVIVELDKLTKQEVLGLSKAVKTKVISVIEGESELLIKAESFINAKFKKNQEEVAPVALEVFEEKIEKVEEKIADVVVTDEVNQEVVTEKVEVAVEVAEVKVTPVRKRTVAKK